MYICPKIRYDVFGKKFWGTKRGIRKQQLTGLINLHMAYRRTDVHVCVRVTQAKSAAMGNICMNARKQKTL